MKNNTNLKRTEQSNRKKRGRKKMVENRFSNYFSGVENRVELLRGMRDLMVEEWNALKLDISLITKEIEKGAEDVQ